MRKAPIPPAKDFPLQVMRGLDGNMWKSFEKKNGGYQWRKIQRNTIKKKK